MTGFWSKEDQEWWNKPENRFIYYFNLLFTSPKWELFEVRNEENVKPREAELKRIFLQSVNDSGVTKEEAALLDSNMNLEHQISELLQMEQPITESEAQDLAHLICELPGIKK